MIDSARVWVSTCGRSFGKGVNWARIMSRSGKNWTWAASAGAAVLIAIMGWAFSLSANSQTRAEADDKYATKESVELLRGDVKEVKGDVKTLLQRTAPHYREVQP